MPFFVVVFNYSSFENHGGKVGSLSYCSNLLLCKAISKQTFGRPAEERKISAKAPS